MTQRKTGGSSLRRFLQICVYPLVDKGVDGCAVVLRPLLQGFILLRRQPDPQLLLRCKIFFLRGVFVRLLFRQEITSFLGK